MQEEDANQLHLHHQLQPYNPRNGEFTCPLCRQLGNCVLPIVPTQIMPTGKTASKVSIISCKMYFVSLTATV